MAAQLPIYCNTIVDSTPPEAYRVPGRPSSLGTVDVCGTSRRCDACKAIVAAGEGPTATAAGL